MARYQRKPNSFVPFEANQWAGENSTVPGLNFRDDGTAYVKTIQERDVDVSPGEWIIQEPDGNHYYPCSDAIFRERYELSAEVIE